MPIQTEAKACGFQKKKEAENNFLILNYLTTLVKLIFHILICTVKIPVFLIQMPKLIRRTYNTRNKKKKLLIIIYEKN